MITEAPTLTPRTVTVDECRALLVELGWSRRTIHLLLSVPPKPKAFAAGSF